MKIRDVLKRLKDDGWYLDRTEGSHRVFKHGKVHGAVVVAGHPADDLAPGTWKSICRQAGWEKRT